VARHHCLHRKLRFPYSRRCPICADGTRKTARAYRYALTATLASTFGGIAGYYLGHYAYEEIAKPILAFYGKLHIFEQLRSLRAGMPYCWC